jgi:hypothetical protein
MYVSRFYSQFQFELSFGTGSLLLLNFVCNNHIRSLLYGKQRLKKCFKIELWIVDAFQKMKKRVFFFKKQTEFELKEKKIRLLGSIGMLLLLLA